MGDCFECPCKKNFGIDFTCGTREEEKNHPFFMFFFLIFKSKAYDNIIQFMPSVVLSIFSILNLIKKKWEYRKEISGILKSIILKIKTILLVVLLCCDDLCNAININLFHSMLHVLLREGGLGAWIYDAGGRVTKVFEKQNKTKKKKKCYHCNKTTG